MQPCISFPLPYTQGRALGVSLDQVSTGRHATTRTTPILLDFLEPDPCRFAGHPSPVRTERGTNAAAARRTLRWLVRARSSGVALCQFILGLGR